MKYKFENITVDEIACIGQALDLLPHGRVRKLVDKMQAQITAQEAPATMPVRSDDAIAAGAAHLKEVWSDLHVESPIQQE